MRAGVKPGLEHAEELSVFLIKKEPELTRARTASIPTSQTPTPEATLREVPEQVKDKRRSQPLKYMGEGKEYVDAEGIVVSTAIARALLERTVMVSFCPTIKQV